MRAIGLPRFIDLQGIEFCKRLACSGEIDMRLRATLTVLAAAALMIGCGGGASTSMSTETRTLAQITVVGGVATFSGNRANYTITKSGSTYTVKDNVGTDGTNSFGSAQSLKFADVTLNLGIGDKSKTLAAADLKLLVELYIAYFNRVPDADGLSYWIDQFKSGRSIDLIAESFYDAAIQYSSLTGYSASMTNSDFVKIIYKNVLGRSGATAPTDTDVAYWAGELDNGNKTRGSLIKFMLGSAHSFTGDATWGWVAQLLDNKDTVANYFSIQQGLNYNTSTDSITRTMAIAAAVTSSDTSAAITLVGMTDAYFNLAPVSSSVSGTAATGAPLASVTLTLKDSTGKTASATTGGNGSFSIDTTGLVGPFLLQATTAGGIKLYGVSAGTDASLVVNLTPLTDLVIRSWYGVQQISIDTAFASPATNPAPSPAAVKVIENVVQNIVQLWLDKAGVSTSAFSLISTPFSANGTGVDLVLSRTTINQSTGAISITDGTTTQATAVSYGAGSIDVATTTTSSSGSSSSISSNAVPVQTAQSTALNDITAGLNSFTNVVNSKGASLKVDDLLPFLASDLLAEGLDRTQFATDLVSEFAGSGQTLSAAVLRIKSLDIVNNVADVVFQATVSKNGLSEADQLEFFFKKVNGAWLLSGDQRIAKISLKAEMQSNVGLTSCASGQTINVYVEPPQGTVSGVTISGGGWTARKLIANATVVDPAGLLDFYIVDNSCETPASIPAAGTVYTFALATANGTVTYQETLNTATTDATVITSPTTTSLADAHPGSPLTVIWRLPTTFPIARIKLHAIGYTGSQNDAATLSCNSDTTGSDPILGTTSTSGAVTIPATCGGKPVTEANLNLNVDGVNGERATVIYTFK
jgi:hypothetical protein